MSSISGIKSIVNNSLSQTNALKCKAVKCTNDISGNTIVGTPSSYLTNITSNVQDQLNSIITYDTSNTTTINNIQSQLNNITSTSTSGGGYFTLVAERIGYGTFWGYGAGCYNNTQEIVLPACTLVMARTNASVAPVGPNYFGIYKNNVLIAEITLDVASFRRTTYHNLTFAYGDSVKIATTTSTSAGFGGNSATVNLRMNLVFECLGVKGADGISPTLTIGTVSTLPSTSNATITNTGTSTNQIINYGIPRGIQGERGYVGLTPILSIGSVVNLPQGSTPYVNFDATSTDTNKIFNFGLVNGITPTFTIGSVIASSTPSVSFDATSTDTNKILNFALVQGATGDPGQSIKGDKGDPGKNGTNGIDAGDIGNAIGRNGQKVCVQDSSQQV